MSAKNKQQLPPLSKWETELLRITAFAHPNRMQKPMNRHQWEKLVGEPPENVSSQPRSNTQIESGNYLNGILTLEIHPDRFDLRYMMNREIGLESELSKYPTLGSFIDILTQFQDLLDKWIQLDNPSWKRIAFGGVLLQPVDDLESGYKLLSRYIPVEIDPETTSDFIYRINRRRTSTSIPDLKINRLSTWSVAMAGKANVTLSMQPDVPSKSVGAFNPVYACRVELDINTAQEYDSELPPEQEPDLFSELVSLVQEIAENGDIP